MDVPPPPELAAILKLVETELASMLLAGEVGTVTVHCGKGDLSVEVTSKRKHAPVRFGRRQSRIPDFR